MKKSEVEDICKNRISEQIALFVHSDCDNDLNPNKHKTTPKTQRVGKVMIYAIIAIMFIQ